jgi:mannose-6-phosphate isomerase-like protein (cupin superfamily)
MSSPIIAQPLSGNVMGSVENAFIVAEWREAGGPKGPPRLIAPSHVHYADDEAWYVLEGDLCIQLGKDKIEAHAGSGVFAPKGTPHTYWNPGPGSVRYLLVMTSNLFRLIQELHVMADRTPTSLGALFWKYNSELVDMELAN